jgi:hypothetical protein
MRSLTLLVVASASFLGFSEGALAQAPPPVAPHQHFLVLPEGSNLSVGPYLREF